MARRTRKKARMNANIIYVLASMFSILFLVSSVFFTNYAQEKNHEQIKGHLQNSTKQVSVLLNAQFDEDLQMLSAGAAMYEKELADEQSLKDTLMVLQKNIGRERFTGIGVGDKNGDISMMDENGRLLSGKSFLRHAGYRKALRGTPSLSNIVKTGDGEDYYYNFVPMGTGRVLLGRSQGKRLEQLVRNATLDKQGYVHIVDSKGNVVLKTEGDADSDTQENILTTSPPLSTEMRRQLQDDLSRGRGNTLLRKPFYEKEARWGSYEPLNQNGWFLFYTVPEPMINFGYDMLTNGMIVIVAAAILIFVFFIFLIRNINRANIKSLEEQVYTDPLTGQHTFQKFLIDSKLLIDLHHKIKYSVWYCDIKNFKYINDLMGYSTGDNLLNYWASILSQDTHRNETFGRVSADNFVLLREYESDEEVMKRFDAQAELLAKFSDTAAHGYKVEVSAGVFVMDMEKDGELTLNDMLDRANLAQKSVKHIRGSKCAVYSDEIRQKIIADTEMETRMENALATGEFEVYLQPKIAIHENNRVMGAEALVRWNWPGRGLVPPGEFIPLFEKNGFIVQLDEYMMEEVCRMYRKFILDVNMPAISLCVNVSRVGIYQQNFIERYVGIKNKYNIPDGCLELEFTESIAFEDHERFQSIIRELQENGFTCSLDDFGSGHSSLNILKDLSVDVLKIDRLFFLPGQDKRRDHDLIQSIINMARSLNMVTVAEGVECDDQVDDLRNMSCDIVQGYVFARPMPLNEFYKYLLKVNGLAG